MPDKKISELVDGGDPQPDDEFVVARAGDNFKLAWSSLSNAATQDNLAVTLAGHTAGVLADISSGTMTLAGGNNITVSQVGNAVTISGANAGGAQTGISGIANSETTYSSGTVSLSELGALTIRSSTGQIFQFEVPATSSLSAEGIITLSTNGSTIALGASQSVQPETQTFIGGIVGSDATYTSGTVVLSGTNAATVRSGAGQKVIIDVPVQSVQPETQTFVGGLANSQTTYTSGTIGLSELGAVTIRSTTGNQFQISVNSQSVQPETQTFVGGIKNSQTTYTSGTIGFSELGAVTIRSTTGNQFQISVNSQSVQPETQTFVGGIANSQTTYTSGTIGLSELGAITIRSTTGNQYQLSVNSQTAQTQGILNMGVSTGGNTSGDTTVNSGTRLVFVGSNNITLSQGTAANATTITVSGPTTAAQTVQTQGILNVALSNVGNTSGDTGINSGTRYILAGGNNVTLSGSSAANATTVTISAANQSVQTQDVLSVGVSTGGNTSGNTTVNTGSRLVIVGSNGITASQGTAAGATTITLSGVTTAAQTVQTQGILNVALSNVGNTSGDTGINSGTRYILAGGNNVTLSASSAANATTVTISAANQTAQTQGILNAGVSTGGNTSGDTTVNSGTRLVLVGTNNITLSQGTAANATTITVSGPTTAAQTVQTQGILNVALSNVGNTSGDTGINSGTRMILAGGNNVTLSASSAANATTITVSAANQSVQTQDVLSVGVSTGGNTSGNTTVNTGSRLVIVGSNGITASQGTAAGATTITLSGVTTAAQTVQTQGILNVALSNVGNTSGDTGINSGTRMILAGGNNVTLSASSAANATTITVSAANQTVQTQGILNVALSNVGNTSGDTGLNSGTRMVLAGGNNITLSASSAANATTVTVSGLNMMSAGMSTGGNTAGDTGYASQRLNLHGGNNITLSGSTNGGSMTISMIGPSPGAAQYSVGVSNLGNTAGSTGVTGTRIVLAGTNMVSLSQSTDATGATISVNATQSVQTQGIPNMGVSTGGATSGDTTVNSGTRFVLVGTNATLSQGTAANATTVTVSVPGTSSLSGTGAIQISTNGSTISIGDGAHTGDYFDNMTLGASTTFELSNGALHVWPLNANGDFPFYMSASTMLMDMSGTVSTGAAFTRSVSVGFYTLVNSTSLALAFSASTSWGTNAANANVNTSMAGKRWVSLHSSQFNNAPNFNANEMYFFGIWARSSSGSQTFAHFGAALPYATGVRSGFMSVGSSTNTTLGNYPWLGNYSVSFSTAMPSALAASDVNKSNNSAVNMPRIIFNNIASNVI